MRNLRALTPARRAFGSAALAAVLALSGAGMAAGQQAPASDRDDVATTTEVALSQVATELRAALADRDDLGAAYMRLGYRPVWLDEESGATAAAKALLATLSEADRHALPSERYNLADLTREIQTFSTMTPAAKAALEIALSRVFVTYSNDITAGVLEPRKVDRELYIYPERASAVELLEALTGAADPGKFLEALAPKNPAYRRLVERYRSFRLLAETGGWGEKMTGRQTLRPGQRSGDVAVLRARLTEMGYFSGEIAAPDETLVIAANDTLTDAPQQTLGDPLLYDEALVSSVQLFQARHGLNQDGVVGPATRAALNVEPGFRTAQIAVNLERMRWLNKDLGAKHIMVNLASFDMAVIENGETAFTSRVVVGKARRHRTPEFSDEIEHMVVNPTWYVPYSIASQEILPKLQEDPGYLDSKNMTLHGADPWTVDWSQVTRRDFPGRITQGPGTNNALGRVKFMFPNDHAIYLHDTPSKSLFNRDARAYSHGCVRVQRPYEFAEYLLSAQEEDAKGKFERLLRRGKERYVHLDEHVPVHLTYRTAWVDDQGFDQFRGDIYGRDRKVLAALEKAGVVLPKH